MKLLRSPLASIAVFLSTLIVALCFCSAAVPQGASGPSSAAQEGRVFEWVSGEHIPPTANLPFTARVELETANQLSDGTMVTHKTYNLIARDSLGRTRNEGRRWIDFAPAQEPQILRITLYDPAIHTCTQLFPLTKIARQWVGAAPSSPQLPHEKGETSREDLGTDTLEGLLVRGERVSQTYPTATFGNDRPVVISTESWYSAELQINLLTKRSDPRFGMQTVRVTQLLRQEPDPSLFDVSGDYKVTRDSVPPQEGAAKAGANGNSIPTCLYCPNPEYNDKARAAKLSGSVVLRIVVTAEGNAENITVVRKLGLGLDEKAVEAVQKWRFKPASGPDGTPVATVVPVEVTFRLR